jgi:metal-dependent HD superfamily phosphatase/phosphodiesterase
VTEHTLITEGSQVSYANPDEQDASPPRRLLSVPTRRNPKLQRLLDEVNADLSLDQLWRCANINAVDRSGMSDHGPVHIRIVSNIALKLGRLLHAADVPFGVVTNYGMSYEDAEVVILLGVVLHDIGMSVHRHDHELYSFVLGAPKSRQLLSALYEEPQLTVMVSETMHAVVSHRSDEKTYTIEAGVVKVADALDMSQGRSRIPFEAGSVNIHSLSAAAVEKVRIGPGKKRPICVEVLMNNSAGLFQLDDLLKPKIESSSLAKLIEVEARIETETEKRLLQIYNL